MCVFVRECIPPILAPLLLPRSNRGDFLAVFPMVCHFSVLKIQQGVTPLNLFFIEKKREKLNYFLHSSFIHHRELKISQILHAFSNLVYILCITTKDLWHDVVNWKEGDESILFTVLFLQKRLLLLRYIDICYWYVCILIRIADGKGNKVNKQAPTSFIKGKGMARIQAQFGYKYKQRSKLYW